MNISCKTVCEKHGNPECQKCGNNRMLPENVKCTKTGECLKRNSTYCTHKCKLNKNNG